MFTKTSTYTNTTGSWASIEEAVTQIESALETTKTADDIVKLNALSDSDVVENTPTLSADGTSLVFIKQVSKAALDVFDGLSETAGNMPTDSTVTKVFTAWTPVGE